MSIITKTLLLLFGYRKKEETIKKRNAVKFSKALKQSITEDIKSLTIRLDEKAA